MNDFITFFSFQDYNVRIVVLGCVLLGISTSVMGSFSFLQKKALIGDVVAHSVLPGVGFAFMLTSSKNILILLFGAVISGWLSLLIVNVITNKSKIKSDSALATVLSFFFSLGILIFSIIQSSNIADQSGLDHFIFGKAAGMNQNDIYILTIISAIILFLVIIFYKNFQIVSFNRDYAKTLGLPIKFIDIMMSSLTVLAIASGIRTVGAVLMIALLVIPATTARYYTYNLKKMIIAAAFIGGFSGLFGSYISYTMPAMPTGPWIVMALSFVVFISVFFAPKKGIFAKERQRAKNKNKVLTENILKTFYTLAEQNNNDEFGLRTKDEIVTKRFFNEKDLKKGFSILEQKNLITINKNKTHWKLTQKGLEISKRIVRLHRLWEIYLTTKMNLKTDHIHPIAESVEHIITPELEKELEIELGRPKKDPHNKNIPYS